MKTISIFLGKERMNSFYFNSASLVKKTDLYNIRIFSKAVEKFVAHS